MKKITLHAKKTASVKRFHPWIFSGAIKEIEEGIQDGEVVEVYTPKDEFIAIGHYQKSSIAVRIISFEKRGLGLDFWEEKINAAYQYRQQLSLLKGGTKTNCYRLIHAEGDGLPGLIIDIYGNTAVVQCHSIGMHLERMKIAKALEQVLGTDLTAIFDKSKKTLPREYADQISNGYLLGSNSSSVVYENENAFTIDWETGQKTGFFLDQRDNRHLLAQYSAGKSVLNTFCYSGGFSIYALKAGARLVHSVDISQKAIDLTEKNVTLNGFAEKSHKSFTSDVLKFLKESTEAYDLVIVDPPAFAKNLRKRHNAIQGYKRLNVAALRKVAPGGLMFTFSCSQVVDRQLFYDTIVAAAIEAGRQVKVMHLLSQPADHPVSLFHAEGSYLKGLVLWVA